MAVRLWQWNRANRPLGGRRAGRNNIGCRNRGVLRMGGMAEPSARDLARGSALDSWLRAHQSYAPERRSGRRRRVFGGA